MNQNDIPSLTDDVRIVSQGLFCVEQEVFYDYI